MFNYVLRYGAPAGAIVIVTTITGLVIGSGFPEAVGYAVMLLALTLVFVGVRRYRENETGGTITFWRAFGLGALIALVAGIVYVVFWEIYLAFTGYTFFDDYLAETLASMEARGASEAQMAAQRETMDQFRGVHSNPVLRPLVTLSEILPLGLLVALVSAGILRRPAGG